METRTDVLVAEARRLVRFERKKGWMLEEDIDIIRRLADALEAATGGQHVESKHWVEVGRLRSENLRLQNEIRHLSESSQPEPEYVDGLREQIVTLNRELEAESAALVGQAEAWWARLNRIRMAIELLGREEVTQSGRRWLDTTLDKIMRELDGEE